MTGFYIAEVRFRGPNVPDESITLQSGLCVVAGPSNTGKSLLRTAISFVFGVENQMKQVPEGAPYTSILVEVRTYDGTTRTYERAWNGGDISEYHTHAAETAQRAPARTLATEHDKDKDDNISRALLALAALDNDIRLLRNKQGEIGSLSFWLLSPYLLVSEERIITERSPIHRGSEIYETIETALFRTLLTGTDDRSVVKTISTKERKALAAGREVVIGTMRAELQGKIERSARTEAEAQRAVDYRYGTHRGTITTSRIIPHRHEYHRATTAGSASRERTRPGPHHSN
jgi:hypothetical protein